MANQINIGVGANIKDLQAGLLQAVQTMKDAGKDMSGVAEQVDRLTTGSFKSISQAYRQTAKDAEVLAMHLGSDSDAFKQAAAMAQVYSTELQDVRSKIAGVDMAGTSNQVQKAAGSFNMLGNSVNQLTRELPAFTYSVQTGFMAISNNIPMFVEAIGSIKKANLELAATGAPVQSVFSQISSAVFSWNTALSLGITALTMFSPMIADYISGFGESAEATRKAKQELDDYNRSFAKYIANGQQRAKIQAEEDYNEQAKPRKIALMLLEQRLKQAKEFNLQISEEDIKSKQTLTSELIKLDQVYKDELAAIDKRYNEQKKLEAKKQAQFEVSIFEDKFTKMRESLEAFRSSDSFKAAQDLALPMFDPETINEVGGGLEEVAEAIIKPFVHIRTQVNEELNKTLSDMIKWSDMAAGVMAQAGAALGQALVMGDFQSAGEAIVKQLGGIAIQIGAAMIAIGIPQAAVGLPSGFAYIAGGTALGILGGVMQASGKAPNQQGDGAGNGGYQSDYTPFNPNFAGASQYLMLDSRVRGTDIIISADNQRRQNRRIR